MRLAGRAARARARRAARTWRGAGVDRQHGGELVEGLAHRAHDQEAQHPQQRAEEQPHDLPRQPSRRGVGQHREQRGAPLLVVGVAAGERRTTDAAVGRLGVEDDGLRAPRSWCGRPARRASRSRCRCRRSAAAGSRPPSSARTLRRTSMPGGVDREDLADLVVLALVVLAALQTGLAVAGAGDGEADLQQALERGPLAQLGAEDRGVGVLVGGPQQLLEGVRRRAAVVVEQPDPLALHLGRPARGRGRRPRDSSSSRAARGPTRRAAARAAGRRCRPCCRCRRRWRGRRGAVWASRPSRTGGQPPRPVMADEEHGDGHRSTLARAR